MTTPEDSRLKKLILATAAASLAGCASMQPTYQTESTFVIYDVKPATLDRIEGEGYVDIALGSVPLPVLQARIDRFIAEGGPDPYAASK